MTKNLDSDGLKSIAEDYDLFYIDLWGVMHNGINLHEDAIFTLKKLLEINKNFILLTNAPRPIQPVKKFLEKMGMEKEFRDKVFTSGEAALNYLKKFYSSEIFYHIGPPRDFDLFNDFKNNKSEDINQKPILIMYRFVR
jgi:ribonucleotide monophosphatase NagD (HAD superfamily)